MKRARSLALWVFFLGFSSVAGALPLYTAREGRTCDNCHTLPNSWKNPEKIRDRKCTLSCSACHVDPAGGGLRNASGRFFGQSSLSMTLATHRGYKDSARFLTDGLQDLEREPEPELRYQQARAAWKAAYTAAKDSSRIIEQEKTALAAAQERGDPAEIAARQTAYLQATQAVEGFWRDEAAAKTRAIDAKEALNDARNRVPTPAFGTALGKVPAMAYDQARYGGMNADPLLSLGLDARLATWAFGEAALVFPMQFDTQAALHPAHHLTAYVNAGVLAKSKGFAGTVDRRTPYAVKDAMLIVNELPFNAYAKVGRFLPAFGTRLDDHTSFTRRDFELDHGIQESRVFGAEIGMNTNYPYVNLSVFRPGPKDVLDGNDPLNDEPPPFTGVPGGIGGALSAGYRELGWQVGVSAMSRRRDLADGGNTDSLSLQWGLNPWFYRDNIPVTYLGEYAIGQFQREGSGNRAIQAASTQELNYTPFNGINLRVKYDFTDPDFEVKDDHQHRAGFGTDLTLVPGLRLTAMGRIAVAGGGNEPLADFFMFLRGWL